MSNLQNIYTEYSSPSFSIYTRITAFLVLEYYLCTPVFPSFCNLKVITVFKLNTTSN